MTTGLKYEHIEGQREALRIVFRCVYQEPHALRAFRGRQFSDPLNHPHDLALLQGG